MTIDGEHEVHFGRDIVGLFGLIGIFILLVAANIALKDFGASDSNLAALGTLITAIGGLCGVYIAWIVARVLYGTRSSK